MSNRTLAKVFIVVTVFLCLFATQVSGAMSHRKHFRAGKDRPTKVVFNEMEIEVPAGAAEEELTVEQVELDLAGIKKPYGFKAIGKPYRFGPHGKKFVKDKSLKATIRINRKELTEEERSRTIRLFYINREKMRLEEVKHKYDRNTGILKADIPHFSEYVPGITPGWDGNGINPFFDITHGEETVSPISMTLSVRSTVLSLPGRGLNFNLTRAFSPSHPEALSISGGWYWDLPYVDYEKINIPGKGEFYIGAGDNKGKSSIAGFSIYNNNGVYYAAATSPDEDGDYKPIVYLNDGTKVEFKYPYVTVTDLNENWFKYDFQFVVDNFNETEYRRISTLTDSLGRIFNFVYAGNGDLIRVTQNLKNGQKKTILTFTLSSWDKEYCEFFTDSLGRTTSYGYPTGDMSNCLSKIKYPNGARSKYSYVYFSYNSEEPQPVIATQKFFQPNQTEPSKEISYQTSTYGGYKYTVIVNDSSKIKNYFCYGRYCSSPYITNELTYSLSGRLIEQKSFDYYESYYNKIPKSITVVQSTLSGALGEAATYQYKYDNWGNITRIIDPNGTETWMAYANTDSQKDLSFYNPLYQKSRYAVSFTQGWNRPITKATLIKDPDHNKPQLKQTHYKYDTKGNLLRESEIHNGGYLHTDYTYDTIGNITSKTDANGNTLHFEYADTVEQPYKHAFLTRVYKPDTGETIATFDYDFDTGKKTMATDPKGNVYRYEYDAIGRLTKEWLENSDPDIGVTRILTYDDVNNTVGIEFGNDRAGWQKGLIKFHPLFGKPTEIQRWSNGGWVTLKQNIYDTGGRLVSELDGEGHTTTHAYDELNRKIRTQLPDGAVTTWSWDDRLCTITDAKGNQKIQKYDLLDRLIEVTEFPGTGETYTTYYAYDNYDDPDTQKTDSHLVKVRNPRGAETIYSYDNLGRLTRVDYPQDGANPMAPEIYTYDNVGNLTAKTTAKGTKTLEYEYFTGYRLQKVTEADGRVINYTYDANDNPVTQSAPEATYSYTYDARNRVTNMTATLDGMDFNFGYDYDVFGRMTGISYPNRVSPVNYIYDELDRLQGIPGFVNSCEYDEDNKLLEMVYANGVANNFTYDQNDRPTNISAGGGGGLLNLNYTYDPVGNIKQINNDYYDYDGLNRLVWYGNQPQEQLAAANGTIWSYDKAGNMAGKETYLSGVSQGLTSFNYDKANRLWSMGTTTYDNDSAGARIGKTNTDYWGYIYDGESRLTQVSKNGVSQIDCAYDGNGMRIKKVENGKTTYYLYSGPNPLMEYSPTDGKYLYRIYAGKKAIAEEKDGMIKFYHKDHLGSTRVVTDASGAKIAEYKFAPYGEKELSTGEGTEYGFTDKAEDVTTGLKYFGARFYDPEVGRFLTVDPKKDGDNWFGYANNNPLKYIDPDGKEAITAITIYVGMVLTSPDLQMDIQMLAYDLSERDWVSVGLDIVGIAIPGAPSASPAYKAGKNIDKIKDTVKTSKATTKSVKKGDKVYRVWGDAAKPNGKSWTRVDPSTVPNYRDAAGLPNQNTGRFVSEGTIKDPSGIIVKEADPLHGNKGGLDEVIIPDPESQVDLDSVSGANPEF